MKKKNLVIGLLENEKNLYMKWKFVGIAKITVKFVGLYLSYLFFSFVVSRQFIDLLIIT